VTDEVDVDVTGGPEEDLDGALDLAALEAVVGAAGGAPLVDDAGRVRLSFTRIDTLELCPRKFRYQYVDRLPTVPAPQLSFGSSIHAVLEWVYDRKHPVLPSEEEALKHLFDVWDSSGYADSSRDEQTDAYRHAQDVVRASLSRIARDGFRLPAATEAWFELPFDDAVVVGSIDRVDADHDGELHVIDYKTNRKAKSRGDVARSLQLGIYALACEHLYGRLPATVTLDFVVPGVAVTVPLSSIDLDAVRAAVARASDAVRAGRDEPTPNRLCGWCDFRAVCPAWDGDGPDVLGTAVLELTRLRRTLATGLRRLHELETIVASRGSDAAPVPGVGATSPEAGPQ
jgi:putative RecB family exonuclease